MLVRIRKIIIFFISFILLIGGNQGITKAQNVENRNKETIKEKNNDVIKPFKERMAILSEDPRWKELCELWKNMNHFKYIPYKYEPDNQAEFEEAKRNYDKQSHQIWGYTESAMQKVTSLNNSKLLSQEEADYLDKLLRYRASMAIPVDSPGIAGVSCYFCGPQFNTDSKTYEDLESQLDTLENLYSKNQINQQSYDISKKNISLLIPYIFEFPEVLNIEEIMENNTVKPIFSPLKEVNPDIIELIISLNK